MEDLIENMNIAELREKLKEIGIITENQNMFQLFELTLQPQYEKRVFEGKNWTLIIRGRLGLPHKNLLDVILCKKYVYDFIEIKNDDHLKVLYNEKKIKRYISEKSGYKYEQYKELLKDMMQTSIELKTEDLRLRRIEGLISEIITIKNFKPPHKISSIIPEKVTLSMLSFGTMATIFIENELKLSFNKNQSGLTIEAYREISQEITRIAYEEASKLFESFKEDSPIIVYNKKMKTNNKEV